MKKVLLVLVFTLFLIGCNSSHEDIIKSEFKKYVQDNFDDPNDFKEVVSIEIKDTVSSDQLLGILKDCYDLHLKIKKTDSVLFKEVEELMGKNKIPRDIINKISYSERESLMFNPLKKSIELQTILVNRTDLNCVENDVKQIIDSFKYEPTYYIYKIKYRKMQGKNITIHEIASHIDSAKHNVSFYEKNKPLTDDQIKTLEKLSLLNELTSLLTKNVAINRELISGYNQLVKKYNKTLLEK